MTFPKIRNRILDLIFELKYFEYLEKRVKNFKIQKVDFNNLKTKICQKYPILYQIYQKSQQKSDQYEKFFTAFIVLH